MSGQFVTVYDACRVWTAIPEMGAVLVILGLAIRSYRNDVVAKRRRGERGDFGAVIGLGLVLAVAVAVTSRVPTPAWVVLAGPSRVVEGPVQDLRRGQSSWFQTLDFTVEGVPVHVYGEGHCARLVNLPTENGGPIRDGQHVRVSLRAGKVLKFEIRE